MTRSIVDALRASLSFYSRLPVGASQDGYAMPDFAGALWATPVAGAIIGAIGGGLALAARSMHLSPLVAACVAIAGIVVATGALHEDGLADMADGFGASATRERKLAVMRDSRLGAYGVIALVLTLLVRVGALAVVIDRGVFLAALALVSVGALSRVAGLTPMLTLPPARDDGLGASAAAPSGPAVRRAALIACCLGFLPVLGGVSFAQALLMQLAAFGAAAGVAQLARRQIGGYTGDVLGGAQQAAEAAALIALSAG